MNFAQSLWEFRQTIESAIPIAIMVPVIFLAVLVVAYGLATRGMRK